MRSLNLIERLQEVLASRSELIDLLPVSFVCYLDHSLFSEFFEVSVDVPVGKPQIASQSIAVGRLRLDHAQNLQLRLRNQTHYQGIADPVRKVMQTEPLTGSAKPNNAKSLSEQDKDQNKNIDMKGISRRELGKIGATALTVAVAGCAGEAGEDEPEPDDELSREDAAEYVLDYVEEHFAGQDDEAFSLYQDGATAISNENYSRAIRDLELSVEIYEELHDESFDKRNQFDEDQNRYELFHLAWDMYRLMHESAAAWYNSAYAIQVDDDPVEALEWSDEAEALYDGASKSATEYQNTIDAWLEGEDTSPDVPDDGDEETEVTEDKANEIFESWLDDYEDDIAHAEDRFFQAEDAYENERYSRAALYFDQTADRFQELQDEASAEGLGHDSSYLTELFTLATEYFSLIREATELRSEAASLMNDGNDAEATQAEERSDELLDEADAKAQEIEDRVGQL